MPINLEPRHRHDNGEPLVVVIQDKNGARDLASVTAVTLTMTDNATGSVKINRAACTILQTGSGNSAVNKGQVQYDWQPADVNTKGTYRIQWELVFGGVQKITWPGRTDYALQTFMADLDAI